MLALGVVVFGTRVVAGRAEHAQRKLQTELRRLRPHPNFVPTPALAAQSSHIQYPISNTHHASRVTHHASRKTQHARRNTQDAVPTSTTHSQPTSTPTPQPSPTPMPTPTPTLPATTLLAGLTHAWQTWNNCGPATLAMDLSYYGRSETQADTAAVLKPDEDDKNVSPDELAAYARSLGFAALYRVNGDVPRLKKLLSAGIPVIVEMWIEPKPNDGMGHYQLLIGYDDTAGHFTAYDSLDGPDVKLPFAEFDAGWRVFNRTYVVVYRPEQQSTVAGILNEDVDTQAMYLGALVQAQAEAEAAPDDPFAWFNAGSSLTALGRHAEAADAFDQARVLSLPWRMLWYQFGPFEAYFAVERYDDVLALAGANLKNAGDLEESHYWRGRALLALGKPEKARRAFEQAVKYNPNFEAAQTALAEIADK